MKIKLFELAWKERTPLLCIMGCLFLGLGIIFFNQTKENVMVVLRMALVFGWMFILPGYFVMLFSHRWLPFSARIIFGVCSATALLGITSYYLGILGLHVRYHALIIPPLEMFGGLALFYVAERKANGGSDASNNVPQP